jgi:hypothetical protein
MKDLGSGKRASDKLEDKTDKHGESDDIIEMKLGFTS